MDKSVTKTATFPDGITVSVLHTGSAYPDELSEKGILYHYPTTGRPAVRDVGEIQATKNVKAAGLPVLVITRPIPSGSDREARWGWIEDSDDASKLFYISFASLSGGATATADPPFSPTAAKAARKRLAAVRPKQARFRFRVFKRYGPLCGVCGLDLPEVLEAARIVAKKFDGCDDPRNGIVLCRNHHRAFDRGMVRFKPTTLAIEVRAPSTRARLGVTRSSLAHLREKPASEALTIAYETAEGHT